MKSLTIYILLSAVMFAANTSGGLDNALDISASGVKAQRAKMEVIAHNIANVDTVKTDKGTPYEKKTAVLRPVEYFSAAKTIGSGVLGGVRVADIKEAHGKYKRVYSPDHPEADKDGYVLYPDINLTQELVELTNANGAFEANVVVYNTTKAMMQSSLEIGR